MRQQLLNADESRAFLDAFAEDLVRFGLGQLADRMEEIVEERDGRGVELANLIRAAVYREDRARESRARRLARKGATASGLQPR